jgi:hypothetical protein
VLATVPACLMSTCLLENCQSDLGMQSKLLKPAAALVL